jgi:hypothetical protein
VDEHNEKHGDDKGKRVTLGMLKAVYRRGAGAFSTSHRPGMQRGQWAMARVNAFLTLVRRGRPENPDYTSDYDLLPAGHPKKTDSAKSADDDARYIVALTMQHDEPERTDALRHCIRLVLPLYSTVGKNCGTGEGGFQEGNDCASRNGGGSGNNNSESKPKRKIETDAGHTVEEYDADVPTPLEALDDEADRKQDIVVTWDGAKEKFTTDSVASDSSAAETLGLYQGASYPSFSPDAEISSHVRNYASNHQSEVFGGMNDDEYSKRLAAINNQDISESSKTTQLEELEAERADRAVEAFNKIRQRLETKVRNCRIDCCVRLMRGLSVDDETLQEMVKSGYVQHNSLNSWTTSAATASKFMAGGSYGRGGRVAVLLVLKNPAVGYVNVADELGEKETIRPPSSMRITKIRNTERGTVVEVEEAEEYK